MIAAIVLAVAVASPVCNHVRRPFVGTLCVPSNRGKHPAIIVLGGSEGGDSMGGFASYFAAHGYVAASVAYFGAPGLPRILVDIPVETVGRAIAALRARPDVDTAHVGILGISKGGELALLAASTYRQLKAVVPIVPSPVAFMGLGENGAPTGCSWSLHGRPLPCVAADRTSGEAIEMELMERKPMVLKPLYDASLAADPKSARAAFFPLQRIDGPVLCLSAEDDQVWNSPAQCAMTMKYLGERHHPFADRAISYPGAGHLFLLATNGPASAMNDYRYGGGVTIAFGGTPGADSAASQSALKTILAFLKSAL